MLELVEITKSYHDGEREKQALNGITLSFDENTFVVIDGATGSGKTTLLRIMAGECDYTGGDLLFCGKSLKRGEITRENYKNNHAMLIESEPTFLEEKTLSFHIKMMMQMHHKMKKEYDSELKEKLHMLSLSGKEKKEMQMLSSYERKKAALLLSLISDPEILLIDEPSFGLSEEEQAGFISLLKEESEKRIVITTGDQSLIFDQANRIITLSSGAILSDRMTEENEKPVLEVCGSDVTASEEKSEKKEVKSKKTKAVKNVSKAIRYLFDQPGSVYVSFLIRILMLIAFSFVSIFMPVLSIKGSVYENLGGILLIALLFIMQCIIISLLSVSGILRKKEDLKQVEKYGVSLKSITGVFIRENLIVDLITLFLGLLFTVLGLLAISGGSILGAVLLATENMSELMLLMILFIVEFIASFVTGVISIVSTVKEI